MADEETVSISAKDIATVVVTGVGISVNSPHGDAVNARLEKAMADEVLKCGEEGISTEEKNAHVIRARMREAHDRELAAIEAERT